MGFALDLQRMQFRKLGLPFEPPGPFWFEDLMFFVVDETRRLPQRAVRAATHLRRLAETAVEAAADFDPTRLLRGRRATAPVSAVQPHREVEPLNEPEAWLLATEPLVAAGTGLNAALACQAAAAEQIDSLTYVLARMRDELRPIMTTSRFEDETVEQLPDPTALETSIEALLELSRKNAATRPKDRVRPAA
jgi:hypothetical protein